MEIKKEHLETLWYENGVGDKHFRPNDGELHDPPSGFIFQHSRFPRTLTHNVLRLVQRGEVDSCEHPSEHVAKTYGWIDGMEGRECKICHGTQVKPIKEPWPDEWDAHGSRTFCSINASWSEDLVLAMANSEDYSLSESIIIAATACERCMNALAFKYGMAWGYEERSEEWLNVGTSCQFCEIMDHKENR